jgi:hypothetical protein
LIFLISPNQLTQVFACVAVLRKAGGKAKLMVLVLMAASSSDYQ